MALIRRWASLALTVGGPTALALVLLDLGFAAFAGDAGSPVRVWLAGWVGVALGVGAAIGWTSVEALRGRPLSRASAAGALGLLGSTIGALQPTYVLAALDGGPGDGLERVVVLLQGAQAPAVALYAGLLLACSIAAAAALHTRAARPGPPLQQGIRAAHVTVVAPLALCMPVAVLSSAGVQSSILLVPAFALGSALFAAPLAVVLVLVNAAAKVELSPSVIDASTKPDADAA